MLGKYLSPKIYVGYSMGIADAFNVFRVRYYFNKQLSAQSESSTNGNGVDMLYTIEKD
jgi:translocation and assembly module TamB